LKGLIGILKDNMFEIEDVRMPFLDTEYCTEDNFRRLSDTSKVSPPFLGNVITVIGYKK
jgi:hypothetical protein